VTFGKQITAEQYPTSKKTLRRRFEKNIVDTEEIKCLTLTGICEA
jgi:hypothetical protein